MGQAFVQHLEKESQYFQCLLQLTQAAEGLLIANEREALDENTAQQERCLSCLASLSKERDVLIRAFAPSSEPIGILALLPQMKDLKDRIQIQALAQKIETHLKDIQVQNQLNQTLIQQGMKYIEHSMDLMGEMAQSQAPQTYSMYGQMSQGLTSGYQSCDFNA